MNKIKLITAAVMLSTLLSFGSPAIVSSKGTTQMPPAVVFVQDEKERMLIHHNFAADNGLLIPWDITIDDGIWAD